MRYFKIIGLVIAVAISPTAYAAKSVISQEYLFTVPLAEKVVGQKGGGPSTRLYPDKSSAEEIMVIQKVFYSLGLDVEVNGVFDLATRKAIKEIQKAHGVPQTGQLSWQEWKSIRNFPPPKIWGALSVSSDGKYAVAYNQNTRAAAELLAMSRCFVLSKAKDPKCMTMSLHTEGWIVALRCVAKNKVELWFGRAKDEPKVLAEGLMVSIVVMSGGRLNQSNCQIVTSLNIFSGLEQKIDAVNQ